MSPDSQQTAGRSQIITAASPPTSSSIAQALELAREDPESASDPVVSSILETALSQIWAKIQAAPNSYLMTRDEFAVFNYFQHRFTGQELAVAARRRYWDSHRKSTDRQDPESLPADSSKSDPNMHLNTPSSASSSRTQGSTDEPNYHVHFNSMEYTDEKACLVARGEFSPSSMGVGRNGRRSSKLKLFSKISLALFVITASMFYYCMRNSSLFASSPPLPVETLDQVFQSQPVRPPAPKKLEIIDIVRYQATSSSTTTSVVTTSTPALEVFQVYQPVLTPSGLADDTTVSSGSSNTTTVAPVPSTSNCTVTLTLMKHDFAYSYGSPFVGNYTPPNCSFNRVTMNFTLVSKGRQYDRLALMYLGDTEVWRTSTPEPTSYGIHETYVKDMSEYLSLWLQPQKLIFDLGNLVDSTYTGIFNTTLTATFFNSEDTVNPAPLIIPISARESASDSASLFTLPADNATNTIAFPQNANRAVFTVSACGQSTEEFWWSNVLTSDEETFEDVDGTLYGYSPFREVQVFIDGQLAGVQWPFPVIFTGGVVPSLWRPIVGIDAYDLREHEIDITPWLPVLCDGDEHTFEIKVAGLDDNGGSEATITETVGSSWYVTGKIFVWLDDEGSITTGTVPTVLLPAPVISVHQVLTQNATGANETLTYSAAVSRTLSISSTVKTQRTNALESWTQTLSFYSASTIDDYGYIQWNNQTTSGMDQSTGSNYYKTIYEYPIWANTTYWVDPSGSGNYSITASIDRGLDLAVYGNSVFPTGLQPFAVLPKSASLVNDFAGSQLSTRQNGSAYYFAIPAASTSTGFGSTEQNFVFSGIDQDSPDSTVTELYTRHVEAVNSTIVYDNEVLVGSTIGDYSWPVSNVGGGYLSSIVALQSPREALGRGPGDAKPMLAQAGSD